MSHDKNYLGMFPGEVVSVEDPEHKCRVKVLVYELFDGVSVADLPWATQTLPLGSRPGEGAINPVQVGDKVFIQFVGGDTRRPVITGASQDMPKGKVNLPADCSKQGSGYSHKRTGKQPEAEESPYYQDVIYQQNNSLIQLCRSGTIRITQMTSGSAIELKNNGDIILHGEGDLYMSVSGKTIEEYSGDVEQFYSGNLTQHVGGSIVQNVAGNKYVGVQGSSSSDAGGGNVSTGDWNYKGSMTFTGNFQINGNVNATGSVIDGGGNTNHHSH